VICFVVVRIADDDTPPIEITKDPNMQFDLASMVKPVAVLNTYGPLDGIRVGANIDTLDAGSLTLIVQLASPVLHSAITWQIGESDDGTTYTNTGMMIDIVPKNSTVPQLIHHIGWAGKKRYVTVVCNAGGVNGTITGLLGNLRSNPSNS
jgi:hypothetical protein